jgi:hypothetical protein
LYFLMFTFLDSREDKGKYYQKSVSS